MINSLEIENFKCFEKETVPLNSVTILTGVNGVGKSTIIQSFLLIRQTFEVLSHNILTMVNKAFKSEGIKDNLAIGSKIMLNGPYKLFLGTTKEILNTDSNEIIFGFSSGSKVRKLKYNASQSEYCLISNYISSVSEKEGFNIFAKSFYYLAAERLGPRNIQELIEQDFLNTGVQGEYTGYAISEIEKNNLKLSQEDLRGKVASDGIKYLPIKKQIEAWMDFILPGIEINVEDYKKISSARVSIRSRYADTDFLHPYNIGFGITYVLPIVVTGLIAKEGSMFIVENPEAHLHPNGQSKIGQFLSHVAASGVQVIVETHSEHVLNGFRIASLKKIIDNDKIGINYLFFNKEKSGIGLKNISIDKKGELSEWPQNFFDQEENDLSQILHLGNK